MVRRRLIQKFQLTQVHDLHASLTFRRLVIVGLILIAAEGYGQATFDSLKRTYEELSPGDTSRFLLLKKLSMNASGAEEKLLYGEKLLEEAKAAGNERWEMYADILIGTAYRLKSDLNSALTYFIRSSEIAQLHDEAILRGQSLLNIADVYSIIGNNENALNYYRESIRVLEKASHYKSLISAYMNLGDHFFNREELDSALFYFLKVKEHENHITRIQSAYNLGNISLVLAKQGETELAIRNFDHVTSLLTDLGEYYPICVYQVFLAQIYSDRGDLITAIQYGESSLSLARKYGFKEQIRDAYKTLGKLYEQTGDLAKALFTLKQFNVYNDSINNIEIVQKLADQRTKYEVGQKQAEVDLLTAEKKVNQVILFAAIGFSIVFIVLAAIVYKYYRNKSTVARILEVQKQELERLNHTKDRFFSIISHDLRGPVSSFFGISRMIKFLVESKETDELLVIADDIDQSVERLSSLLDNLLNWASQQQGHIPNVPEKLEFKNIALDLAATFKTMADSKLIDVKVDVNDSVHLWADRNMTMTIFRNLLNNALKFTPEGGSVTLFAMEKNGTIEAGVRDTGVGIPQEKLGSLFELADKKSTYGTSGEKGLGLGLQLVHEFVELNNGNIKVESETGAGTTFILNLPAFSTEMSPIVAS